MRIKRVVKLLSSLANENRVAILLLSSKGFVEQGELIKELKLTQSGLLKHLKILEEAMLITREGGACRITELGSEMIEMMESIDERAGEEYLELASERSVSLMEGFGFTVDKEALMKLLEKKKNGKA